MYNICQMKLKKCFSQDKYKNVQWYENVKYIQYKNIVAKKIKLKRQKNITINNAAWNV